MRQSFHMRLRNQAPDLASGHLPRCCLPARSGPVDLTVRAIEVLVQRAALLVGHAALVAVVARWRRRTPLAATAPAAAVLAFLHRRLHLDEGAERVAPLLRAREERREEARGSNDE